VGFSIAEAAEHLGLTPHTLRYYERDGLLLTPVQRDGSGHRRYTDGDLEWITMIARLRATGMPIRDVRRYAELVRAGDGNEAERLALLQAHRQAVNARLAEVTRHLDAIDNKIRIYLAAIDTHPREPLDLERARR
jgi:DNA-binding transcriptional MerR regulator